MVKYCNLMQEIKIRDQSMAELSSSPIPAQIAYESCYLQLRMICELIAIGCLVVHGDIPAITKKLKKSWDHDFVIKRLSEIHPDFYPHPKEPILGDRYNLRDVTEDILTKSELLALYGKSGDRLHRGTAENALSKLNPNNVSFVQIQAWRTKIVRLLQHHWITLYNSPDRVGVQMNAPGQSPSWNYWGKVENLSEIDPEIQKRLGLKRSAPPDDT
jgi:hypothetical protein